MARILAVAHDLGGANMLLPVLVLARSRGHEITARAAGPAEACWQAGGLAPAADAGSATDADVVVTGTSRTADLELLAWREARAMGKPSLAAVDCWGNFQLRFSRDGLLVQPDVVGLADEWCRTVVAGEGWCSARTVVVGQPHLEALTARMAARPAAGVAGDAVCFMSEPLREDLAGAADQFQIAGWLLDSLPRDRALHLILRPHPKETSGAWEHWLAGQPLPAGWTVELGGGATEDVLARSTLVTGMLSMGLLEAALSGIPVVSIQPPPLTGRNPPLDRCALAVATGPGPALREALAAALARDPGAAGDHLGLNGSAERLLAEIEGLAAP